MVVVQGEAKQFEMIGTLHASGGFSGSADAWQQETDQATAEQQHRRF
jgi:hypothetical protein